MEQNGYGESWLVSEQELKILLAGLGYEQIHGLFASEQVIPRCQVLQEMISMMRQGKIHRDGAAFHVSPQLEQLLARMGMAHRVLLLHAEEEYCCYCGAETVLCQSVPYNPQLLRISILQAEQVTELAMDGLPEDGDVLFRLDEQSLWQADIKTLLSAELYQDGIPVMQLSVRQLAIQPPEICVRWGELPEQCIPYSQEEVRKQLTQLLKQEDRI